MKFDLIKLKKLLKKADFILTAYQSESGYVSPVHLVEDNGSVGGFRLQWTREGEAKRTAFASHFINYKLFKEDGFCQFIEEDLNRGPYLVSMLFYSIHPIEISKPFNNVKDLMSLFKTNSQEIIVLDKHSSNSDEPRMFILSNPITAFPSTAKFYNILTLESEKEIDIRRLFNSQIDVKNNSIRLINNIWIKFYELIPISCKEAITE
jgi:hypothetical protein